MLKELKLKNFRCFENYGITFDKFNTIVGKNNTGKSTIVDALKLVSNARRYAAYRKDLELEDRDVPFSLVNLRHNYREEDSIIHSEFSDGTEIDVVFPLDARPYLELIKDGSPISSHPSIRRHFGHSVGIIPPVGVFEETEELRGHEYLRSVMISHLTPRHFRNIWYQFEDGFEEFQELIAETWPGYVIEPPEFYREENQLSMFFRENNFTREIFWAGHGFQVWLQLMTYLIKLGPKETLVLDEPDIYLHSDMQKKLVEICKERSNQVIIASHAVDIIEEVEPEDIISVDSKSKKAYRLSNVDDVQMCITQLGSSQNLRLAHFIRGKSHLFVEGKDFRYLKTLGKELGYEGFASEDGFTVIPLEGFSNWNRLTHVDWVSTNIFGEQVRCFVILDRDYNTEGQVKYITDALGEKDVRVHIWKRKEIENYLIDDDALYRIFAERFVRAHKGAELPLSAPNFRRNIETILEDLKVEAVSQLVGMAIKSRRNRGVDESTIVSKVMREFDEKWQQEGYRRGIVPGKEFFARLNEWLKTEFNVTISVRAAVSSLKRSEIHPEIEEVIVDFIGMMKESQQNKGIDGARGLVASQKTLDNATP